MDRGELLKSDNENDHREVKDQKRHPQERLVKRTPAVKERAGRFYRELDRWMDRVRDPGYETGQE